MKKEHSCIGKIVLSAICCLIMVLAIPLSVKAIPAGWEVTLKKVDDRSFESQYKKGNEEVVYIFTVEEYSEYTGSAVCPVSLSLKDGYAKPDGFNDNFSRFSDLKFEPRYFDSDDNEVLQLTQPGSYTVRFITGTDNTELCTYSDSLEEIQFPFYISYSLSFDANGGTGSMDKVLSHPSEDYLIPECSFTAPEGKEFDGWAYDKKGANRITSEWIPVSENLTIYAVWKNIDGGNPNPDPDPDPKPASEPTKTLNDITFENLMAAYKDINSQIVEVDFGEEEGYLERNVMSLLKESNDVLHVTYKLGGVTYSFYITPDMVELEEGLQIFGPKKLLFYNQTEKKLQATKYIAANIKEAAANSIQGGDVYIVKNGDNLSSIASKYNLTVNDIVKVNIIPNANLITPGMQLTIEYPWIDKSQII